MLQPPLAQLHRPLGEILPRDEIKVAPQSTNSASQHICHYLTGAQLRKPIGQLLLGVDPPPDGIGLGHLLGHEIPPAL